MSFNRVFSYAQKFARTTVGQGLVGVGSEILWNVAGQPDVLLGIIPIYTAQRYEVARSHDNMKYRAVAGQFFAHQRGGNVGFKVVLYLIGPQALDYLTYIQTLHLLGQASYSKVNLDNPLARAISNLTNVIPSIGSSALAETTTDASWNTIEEHFTFPIVTREEIMHGMYIESVIYERDIQFGDAIKVTILCRKYDPPPEVLGIQVFNKSGISQLTPDEKVQIDRGVYPTRIKNISVVRKRKKAASNIFGIAEQALHRKYVSDIADPYTDLEITRSIGGRINGSLYNANGKFSVSKTLSSISTNIDAFVDGIDFFDRWRSTPEEIDKDNVNADLTKDIFRGVGGGPSVRILQPSRATLLKTIVKGGNEETQITISTNSGTFYMVVESVTNGRLKISKLQRGTFPVGYTDSTSSSCYVSPGDNYAFDILIYRDAQATGDYHIYKYDGKFTTFVNDVVV